MDRKERKHTRIKLAELLENTLSVSTTCAFRLALADPPANESDPALPAPPPNAEVPVDPLM